MGVVQSQIPLMYAFSDVGHILTPLKTELEVEINGDETTRES